MDRLEDLLTEPGLVVTFDSLGSTLKNSSEPPVHEVDAHLGGQLLHFDSVNVILSKE